MPGPKNAGLNGSGFRFYSWQPDLTQSDVLAQYGALEPTDVLSVTSIRKLCGETYQLVAWQIANVINVAMGVTKREKIGPRGGRSEIYVPDGAFPGQFVQRLLDTNGAQAGLDEARAWLRDAADKPRDTAATRGTIVHEAIELGATIDRIDEAYVEAAVGRLSSRDQKKVKAHGGVKPEDVEFVRNCVAQYWDMRVNVPFVILAREPQVWNLTAGYAGSADVLVWFLPDGTPMSRAAELQKLANKGQITQAFIAKVGGHVTLGDWKTSKGVYSDQCIQACAYLAAEFVGSDGRIDVRLTEILIASTKAALVHIRPNGWTVHFLDFRADILRAFLGSVAYARFIATYPEPHALFTHDISGAAVLAAEGAAA